MSKNERGFHLYITKVLKQVHPDIGITGEALVQVDLLIKYLLHSIVEKCNTILKVSGNHTLMEKDVQNATRLTLKNELNRHAVSNGLKAVCKYTAAEKGEKGKPIQKSVQAGLVFSVPRVKSVIQENSTVQRIGERASVYATAVVEYMVAELLELSGNCVRDEKKRRITPYHIACTIQKDDELKQTFKSYVMPVDFLTL